MRRIPVPFVLLIAILLSLTSLPAFPQMGGVVLSAITTTERGIVVVKNARTGSAPIAFSAPPLCQLTPQNDPHARYWVTSQPDKVTAHLSKKERHVVFAYSCNGAARTSR